ncbi:hypothetical protein EON65_32040, partial [archaeon]
MERLTPLEDSVTDTVFNESADQTTLECISFEQSDSAGSMQSRKMLLRTSRRRVQKNTAVVLNADKMKRFALDETTMTILEDSVLDTATFVHPPLSQPLPYPSPPHHDPVLQVLPIAAQRIISWWRSLKKSSKSSPSHTHIHTQTHTHAHTRADKMNIKHHDRLFSLLLGYRVRKLLRTHEIKSLVTGHNDVRQVLYDLLPTPSHTHIPPYTSHTHRIEAWRASGKLYGLSDVDHTLALSLYRTLLLAKEKFHTAFFRNMVYVHVYGHMHGHGDGDRDGYGDRYESGHGDGDGYEYASAHTSSTKRVFDGLGYY